MKLKMKKFVSVLLSFCMILTAFAGLPASVYADTPEINGGGTISEDGTYQISEAATGTITIDAGVHATLVGQGVNGTPYTDLYIDLGNGAELTLQDVYISMSAYSNSAVEFNGTGSVHIAGVNEIDSPNSNNNVAMFHVVSGDNVTFDGTGVLYGYKGGSSPYIGVNMGTADTVHTGNITFNGGTWFLKGSKMGPIIGNGEETSDGDNGLVTINSGTTMYLKHVAQGAIIGAAKNGTASCDVVINGGLLELYCDFIGSAIGQGGSKSATVGELTVNGGSIKTTISANALTGAYGASGSYADPVVDWKSVNMPEGNDYALLPVDVSAVTDETFTVKVDGKDFYTGGTYAYVTNEIKNPTVSNTTGAFSDTSSNWLTNDEDWLVTADDYGTAAYPSKSGSSFVPENNLYLALSKGTHTILVNDAATTYNWDSENGAFVVQQPAAGNDITTAKVFSSGTPTDGSVTTSTTNAAAGDTVTVTVDNPAGYYLAELKAGDTLMDIRHDGKYDGADGDFTFTMPDAAVTVTATFVKEIWDGTLDFSWYDESTYTVNSIGSYYMYYPAQWEALAWICSEDLYFLTEDSLDRTVVANLNQDTSSDTTVQEFMDAKGWTHAYQYQTNGNVPLVVGTVPSSTAFSYAINNSTTEVYGGIGQNYFSGKTFYIMQDMDFGGVGTDYYKDSTITTILNSDYATHMSGPNYYPVGSQSRNDGVYMPISAGSTASSTQNQFYGIFCGCVNGQGHLMDNIYCDRGNSTNQAAPGAGPTGGSSWYQSAGLIGRLGMPDNTGLVYAANDCYVENIAVDGFIYTERSVGGIVGKTLHVNTQGGSNVHIRNCINLATICSTQAKGAGGIIGAAWNLPTVDNTVNFGRVINGYMNSSGGFIASDEGTSTNCYTVGMSSLHSGEPCVFGTKNAGPSAYNCYGLVGAAFGQVVSSVPTLFSTASKPLLTYGAYNGDGITAINSLADAQASSFVGNLNKGGRYFTNVGLTSNTFQSTASFKSNGVKRALADHKLLINTTGTNDGFSTVNGVANLPIPVTFVNDDATVTSVTFTSDPAKLSYTETQLFDTAGMVITATWSDGSTSVVGDYTLSKSTGLETTDTQITVSGTIGGQSYTKTYDITVAGNALSSIRKAASPTNRIYAADEPFDKTGMRITATYTASTTAVDIPLEDLVCTEDRANNKVTVSYTYKDVTQTLDLTDITFLSSNAPTAVEGVYPLGTAEDMLWFANFVNTKGNPSVSAALTANIDLTGKTAYTAIGSSAYKYTGTFDGQGHTVILPAGSKSLFNYVNGGTVKNVTTDCTGTISSAAAVVQSLSAGTIDNCINNAAVSRSSAGTGGVVGTMTGGEVKNCVNNGTVACTYNYGAKVGGVVGYMKAGTVTNCVNTGAISSTGSNAGGIIGFAKTETAEITVTGCANRGSVTSTYSASTSYATGGVIGWAQSYSSRALNISDCYNTGAVSGAYAIGGLFGYVTGISGYPVTITNCYNAGTLTETTNSATYTPKYTGAVVGCANGTYYSITNTYYLTDSYAQAKGTSSGEGTFTVTARTSDELKALAATLGTAYKANGNADFNGGYPLLAYETMPDAAHTHSMEAHAAIAATCTTAGNTAYWYCSECGKYFSDVEGTTEITADSWVIAALGHSYGEWVLNGNVYTRTCTHEGCTDVETCKAGDANGDGKLTASDAGALLFAAASSYNFNETQAQAISLLAGSGYAEKAVTILQYLVGLKTSLFS